MDFEFDENPTPRTFSFADTESHFRPTLLDEEARSPPSVWELVQSGNLFRDP